MQVKAKYSNFQRYNIQALESILNDLYTAQRSLQYAKYKMQTFEFDKLSDNQTALIKIEYNMLSKKISELEKEMNTVNNIISQLKNS